MLGEKSPCQLGIRAAPRSVDHDGEADEEVGWRRGIGKLRRLAPGERFDGGEMLFQLRPTGKPVAARRHVLRITQLEFPHRRIAARMEFLRESDRAGVAR